MKVTGVIAEFNPLHSGHAYFLERARETTGADILIVVLSGDFVQRGAPALLSKYARAEMALRCGADLIIELPVFSACASAEYFAAGALRLLSDLRADAFVFGSEAGALSGLLPLAELLCEEPQEYRQLLMQALASGKSFPSARKHAVLSLLPEAAPLLDAPNNLLGLEYLKACKKRGLSLTPHTIPRRGSAYHEEALSALSYPSASALRAFLNTASPNPSALADFMPAAAHEILCREFKRNAFVTEADFSSLLALKLLQCGAAEELTAYADMSTELSNRIFARRFEEILLPDFIHRLKTKELTYTRISRALMHTVLQITGTEQETFCSLAHSPYARLLGMRPAAYPLLRLLKRDGAIPLIMQPARAKSLLSPQAYRFFAKDIACSELYRQLSFARSREASSCEFTHEIMRCE